MVSSILLMSYRLTNALLICVSQRCVAKSRGKAASLIVH